LSTALNLANSHLAEKDAIFKKEGFPIPLGFTDEDVVADAPRLFSDPFHLHYVKNLAKSTMVTHGLAVSLASRSDVRTFVMEAVKNAADLDEQATVVMQSKGLAIRPPYIAASEHARYIESTDFLGSFFGKQRMLNAMEITHLFLNLQSNGIAKALFIGFSQVAHSQELRKFFSRCADITDKHIEVFNTFVKESGLPGPMSLDSDTMASTMSPFSDKLMLYHVVAVMNMALGYYAAAIGASMRSDIVADYIRLVAEIEKLNLDCIQLLIDNGWAEEPPLSPDRKQLALSR